MRTKKFRLVLVFLLLSFVVLAYYLTQPPSRLVVSPSGSINIRFDEYRSFVQGKKFWQNQLVFVNIDLERPYNIKKIIDGLEDDEVKSEQLYAKIDSLSDAVANEHMSKFKSSESYKLKKEAERLLRLSEYAARRESLQIMYESSYAKRDELLKVKSFIERKILSYD